MNIKPDYDEMKENLERNNNNLELEYEINNQ